MSFYLFSCLFRFFFFFFFKQKTAYEMLRSLVGSEMCIRDREAVSKSGVWPWLEHVTHQAALRHAEVVVGVCPSDATPEQALETGCGFLARSGGLLHNSGLRNYGRAAAVHDSIGVALDLVNNQLSFSLNGQDTSRVPRICTCRLLVSFF
eukprot:TRINITY_DN17104_c0_g1_i2.p1 TRINITY_DN17104_c0_g1~~TRINITY_DN17104_c0_g1_i2.p1  ORF type:complete len:150 (+),score=34.29 TRINITY_DN17104_c0_g1_i2:71-520(+)